MSCYPLVGDDPPSAEIDGEGAGQWRLERLPPLVRRHVAPFNAETRVRMLDELCRAMVAAAPAEAQFAGDRTANRKATPGQAMSIQDPSS